MSRLRDEFNNLTGALGCLGMLACVGLIAGSFATLFFTKKDVEPSLMGPFSEFWAGMSDAYPSGRIVLEPALAGSISVYMRSEAFQDVPVPLRASVLNPIIVRYCKSSGVSVFARIAFRDVRTGATLGSSVWCFWKLIDRS